MKKILIISGIILLVVTVTFLVLIKLYITPERVKELVITTAEKSLNRKVNIGEIDVSLFKGIDIKDFALKEADGKNDFISCQNFVLKYKLIPLLTKQVIIEELKLEAPVIHVFRDAKGTYNYETIGAKKEKAAIEKEAPDAAKGLPISLLVNKISINRAKFSLKDATKKLPDIMSGADMEVTIESADGADIFTRGNLDLRFDEINVHTPPAKQIKDVNAAVQFAVHIGLESGILKIDKADLTFQDIPASLTGLVNKYNTSPELDLAFSLPGTDTAKLLKTLSPYMDTQGLKLSGSINADVTVKGQSDNLDSLNIDGKIQLAKVGIDYETMSASLDGDITLKKDTATIRLKSTIGKNAIDIDGTVRDYLNNQKVNVNMYSKHLIIEDVMALAGKEEPQTNQKKPPASQSSGKEPEPMDMKLSAQGELKVDTAIYKGLNMSDFLMQFMFKNNTLVISKMTARAGKGQLDLNSTVDFSKPGYAYKLSSKLDSLHADEVVNALFPKAKDTIFGILSFNLSLNGAGTLPATLKKNLIADADFKVLDGKITDTGISEGLASFLNIGELKTINLTKADGTVKVRNSVARLDSVFASDDLSMDPSGNIGLDETLNLAFDLKMSPDLTRKAMGSGIAQYIKSEEGWGMIPLIVKGTLAKPKYTVDVARAGKRVIQKEADKILDKIFKKKDPEPKQDGAAQKEPDAVKETPDQVKDLLKGFFK